MPRRVVLRPEADADIEEAADYTIATWGHDQALKCIADLRKATEQLSTTAERHPLYDQIIPGLRRKRSGMHHIYYLTSADQVEIVRIMHVQRDPGLHLKLETWRDGE